METTTAFDARCVRLSEGISTDRERFRRRACIGLSAIGALLLAGCLVLHAHMTPRLLVNLAGTWQYKLGQNPADASEFISIPGDLPYRERKDFTGHVMFTKRFDWPSECWEAECSLVVGELGDAATFYLNGHKLGVRGGVPPDRSYEHHYAATIPLPGALARANDNVLDMAVFAPKFELTGPRKGPVGITFAPEARRFSRAKAFKTVFLNVAAGVAMVAIGAFSCLRQLFADFCRNDRQRLIDFCIWAALFLVSFSEIPREYLPLGIAMAAHCVFRYAMDWSLFALISEQENNAKNVKTAINVAFASVIAVYLLLGGVGVLSSWVSHSALGAPAVYRLVRYTAWLNCTGAAFGLWSFLRVHRDNGRRVAVALGALLCLQVYDIALFLGWVQGDYTSKYYLPTIGVIVALSIARRSAAQKMGLQRQVQRQQAFANVARQVAHDIRSPLAALSCVAKGAATMSETEKRMLEMATSRIHDIAEDLLRKPEKDALLEAVGLANVLDAVVTEKRATWSGSGVTLQHTFGAHDFDMLAYAHAPTLSRVLSNLLNNAYEAIDGCGSVEVSLRRDGTVFELSVSDSGKGIPQDVLPRLMRRGATHGKLAGTGLGLAHAREAIESWGGSISISSTLGRGTRVRILLPQSPQVEGSLRGSRHSQTCDASDGASVC